MEIRLARNMTKADGQPVFEHWTKRRLVLLRAHQISRRTENGDWKVIAPSVRRTVFTDTTAISGQKYYYAVRAVNGDVLSKTYDTNKKTTCLKELGAVTLGTFNNVSDGVHLSWSAVPGADV